MGSKSESKNLVGLESNNQEADLDLGVKNGADRWGGQDDCSPQEWPVRMSEGLKMGGNSRRLRG